MGFIKYGSLDAHGAPILRGEVITNSIVTTVGDSVKMASGFIALGTAGASVFGHVVGISTKKDVGVSSSGAAGADFGSFVGTYTAASDNQTVGLVKAICDISQTSLWSGELSAAIGTTTGSNLTGYRMDLTDEDTLNESSAATTTAQYATWGVDARNSARAVVSILESSVFNT